MEVTSKNFNDVLEKFPEILKRAQFVAIDTEFTGLRVDGGSTFNYFDTLKELYEVNKQTAASFLAVQYGICLFEYHPATDSYTVNAFNFFVYPGSSQRNFTCQVSCLKFLSEHGFDFNKLFRDGVPYLRDDEAEAKFERLEARKVKEVAESPSIKVPTDQKKLLEDVVKKISDFLSSEEEEFILPRYNAFIRRLIYQTAKDEFGGQVVLEGDKDGTIRLIKGLSEEEKQARLDQKWEKEKDRIHHEVGFSKIIKLIADSRKPLVGHNVFLDLMFTIQQFLHPLPEDFEEFREMAQEFFPHVIDTKHMVTAEKIRTSAESSLAEVLKCFEEHEMPKIGPAAAEVGYKEGEERPHEAAYDAYITGRAFLAIVERIGKKNTTNVKKTLANSPLLLPFVNKLSTPPLHEIWYMNLAETYVPPYRQNVFHITFPEQWKRDDILTHFKDFGFVNIRFIDNISAFISVGKDYVKKVKQMILKNDQSECKVTAYSDFKQETKKDKPDATDSSGTNRKRYSSEDLGEAVSQKRNCTFPIPAFD